MRKLLTIPFLLPALLLATPVQAAKWTSLGSSKDPERIEVDSDSLHTVGEGKMQLWHRESYAKPRIQESGAFSFSRVTTLSEFQCDKRLAASVQRSYFAADGSELKTENFNGRESTPIAPDSTLDAVFRHACKQRAKPATVTPSPAPTPPPPPVTEAKESPKKSKNGKKEHEAQPAHAPHWSYTGSTGVEQWGSLSEEFAMCSRGQRQSPIDIRKTVKADLPPIQFAYKPIPLSIVDNGHSIKVDTPEAGGITVDGERYELLQFHFHKPSEEKINGKTYDMVVHLVHQSKAGKLAVVAVLLEAGKEQRLIRTLWTHLPLEQDKPVTRPEIKIDPSQLIPAKRNYYTFLGSLTTPPCTEGVLWLVLKTPMPASKEQLTGFGTLYKNNVRPVQPVNNRLIKESR